MAQFPQAGAVDNSCRLDPEGAVGAAALRRNDAYLQGFIEAFHLCPFARDCREAGQLHRELVAGTGALVTDRLAARMTALHRGEAGDFAIGLLIAPEFDGDARSFEAVVCAAADRATQGLAGDRFAFHAVAFHPGLAWSDDDPYRLIGLLRHTPDPTVQLVRATVLERLHAAHATAPTYVDPADKQAVAALADAAKPLSDRIAEANFRTYRAAAVALQEALAGTRRN
jgi:hypothetical protein